MSKYAKDSLGTRMKTYEEVSKNKLLRRTPVIIRLDGKAFHTFTKRQSIKDGCRGDPFSVIMHNNMSATALGLARTIQTAAFVYHQSDEISILLKDWENLNTEAWFDGQVQKITSISASVATMLFNRSHSLVEHIENCSEVPLFDARVFNVPKEEVVNYFVWRQQDATRNSINMLAQYHFSHKELQGKNVNEVQDMMMLQKGVNWNDLESWKKRGVATIKNGGIHNDGWKRDHDTPIFTQDRDYIGKYLISENQ
jgi:tRNA(His) 5'-end guanylyltransferase